LSQLFDSLRRGRPTRSVLKPEHTAQGDAVLATLGYASARPAAGASARVGPVLLLAGAVAAGLAGWNIYHRQAEVRASVPAYRSPAVKSVEASSPVSPSRTASAPELPALRAPETAEADHVESGSPGFAAAAAPARLPGPAAGPTAPPVAPAAALLPATTTVHQAGAAVKAEPAGSRHAPAGDLDLALYYHRAGDFENALQHYRALLSRNELDAQAHNNLGLLYQERNLLDESARELQRAIVIEPGNAGTHNNYGVTLLKQGRADEALAEFGAALRLSPGNVDAIVNTALAQREARNPGLAKETLLRGLALEPKNAAAHYNLGQLYDETGEAARAVEHYRSFLENAGAEYAPRAAAVRTRIEALTRNPE
jgi:Tfp pilus assembly protein PilF